jgi:hypothetical protein
MFHNNTSCQIFKILFPHFSQFNGFKVATMGAAIYRTGRWPIEKNTSDFQLDGLALDGLPDSANHVHGLADILALVEI